MTSTKFWRDVVWHDVATSCHMVSILPFLELIVIEFEPVRDKTNKMDQNIDFCVLVFYDRMGNTLQIGA